MTSEKLIGALGPGKITPEQKEKIDGAVETLTRLSVPRTFYKKLKKEELPLRGEDIKEFLDGSDEVYLLAATLGQPIVSEIKRRSLTDLASAVMLDTGASLYIEEVIDELTRQIEKSEPRFITERYSPGYGDFDLLHQKLFEKELNLPKKLGVTVTESGLLMPRKSVTAVVGVRDRPREPLPRCSRCRLKNECKFGICKARTL